MVENKIIPSIRKVLSLLWRILQNAGLKTETKADICGERYFFDSWHDDDNCLLSGMYT
jgi:hypothetical protein